MTQTTASWKCLDTALYLRRSTCSQSEAKFFQWAARPLQKWIACKSAKFSIRHTSNSARQVILSGIQPTGVPHLGNYLGALKQWVRFQHEAKPTSDLIFSIVDLHAMTLPYNRDQLRLWKRQTLAALLAIGLEPNRSTIFFQSAV